MPLLYDATHNPLKKDGTPAVIQILCTEIECTNRVQVSHEVDYWRMSVTEAAKAWHALQDMWRAAPDKEYIHYESTAAAIDRMRVAQGEPPLVKLRRRTLPRTPLT